MLGLAPEELDLREYFGAEDRLRERGIDGGVRSFAALRMTGSGADCLARDGAYRHGERPPGGARG